MNSVQYQYKQEDTNMTQINYKDKNNHRFRIKQPARCIKNPKFILS